MAPPSVPTQRIARHGRSVTFTVERIAASEVVSAA